MNIGKKRHKLFEGDCERTELLGMLEKHIEVYMCEGNERYCEQVHKEAYINELWAYIYDQYGEQSR